MKSVAFYTLGCKLNFSETSSISRLFENNGYQKVGFEEGADIYVINTCSVTDHADRKCRKVIKEAYKFSDNPFIVIIGCYAQLKPTEIAEIPGVDLVLGASEKFRLMEFLSRTEKKAKAQVHSSPIEYAADFHPSWSSSGDRTRTFLKIQDGCDYSCTFCTIPMARGKSRSDTISNVVESARDLSRNGFKEIVLTGVNTGDFGIREGIRKDRFIDLLRELDKVESIQRIRISSIEPNLLTDEIIRLVSDSGKLMPHFHIPLQSGSNKILKLMKRRYLRELYAERVSQIKAFLPQGCIGADVIVGFPGETYEDFLESYQFINELDVSYLHVFTYSERAHTQAMEMDGIVPMRERHERMKMLRNLSLKKRRRFYETNLGSKKTILFEHDVEEGKMYGFTENYIRVEAEYDPLMINELITLTLSGINDKGYAVSASCEEIKPHH